jgi:hypothetical protein
MPMAPIEHIMSGHIIQPPLLIISNTIHLV